ncbi:hypothetical protein [Microbulbifer celer]|uniref:Uncharacterized protein n=1 Tax=Microbulbifer celer TaxID=435905 RepID=A0ABW3U469_9GAMM|nr:hypothetical protein [Microbulbifer celer]UFN58087.1 hypothetical protein LPW13_03295 [Microbulbifer celer]
MASLNTILKHTAILILVTAISACSGGGSNSTPKTEPPTKEQPDDNPGDDPGENPGENPGDEPDDPPEEEPGEEPGGEPGEKADTTPDAFSFERSGNTGTDVLVYSNIVEISGINQPAEVKIKNGQYSIEGSEFTTDPGTIESGQTIQVRHQSAKTNSATTKTSLTIGGVSSDFISSTSAFTGQLAVASDGLDLILLGFDADGQVYERSRASIPALEDYNKNHQIFSITKHPSKALLFVTSMNECETVPVGFEYNCAGNARIDRFTYDQNAIVYDGLAYLAQPPLRLSKPTVESAETYKSVSFSVTNQSTSAIEISAVVPEYNRTTELSTDCAGNTLEIRQSCNVTLKREGQHNNPSAVIHLNTSQGNFNTFLIDIPYVLAEHRVGYFTPSLMSDHDVGLPLCALTGYYDEYAEWSDNGTLINPPSWNDIGGKNNKAGACMLSGITFNSDGSRAYVTEAMGRSVLTFDVNDSGEMTFITDSGPIEIDPESKIALNAEDTTLYSGANAYTIVNEALQPSANNDRTLRGRVTKLTTGPNYESLLTSIIGSSELEIYQLDTDPLAPTQVTSVQHENRLADYDYSEDLSIFTTIEILGSEENNTPPQITSYSFDGETLSMSTSQEIDLSFDICEACEQPYDYTAHPSTVQMNTSGSRAYSATYINAYDDYTREGAPWLGAILSYEVDTEAGEISELSRMRLDGNSRAMILVDTPETN